MINPGYFFIAILYMLHYPTIAGMIRLLIVCIIFFCCGTIVYSQSPAADSTKMHRAPAPLFRDPIYDGATDPGLVDNKNKKEWWMFYTERRANDVKRQ
jgi:hypothetical protein